MGKERTQFKTGKSGNPKGRPKKPEWEISKLSELQPDAIDAIEDILNDKRASNRDKIAAAKLVLEYTVGKPKQMVDVNANVKGEDIVIRLEGELSEWAK